MRTEAKVLPNKAVEVYTRVGEHGGKQHVCVPILPMNKADDWLDMTAELAEMEREIDAATTAKGTRELKRAYNKRLLEIVCAYNDELLPIDTVGAEATAEEISSAFWRLKEGTDPFDGVQRLAQKRVMEQIGVLPPAVMELAAKEGLRLSESRQPTSSESPETSPEREASGLSETDGHTSS